MCVDGLYTKNVLCDKSFSPSQDKGWDRAYDGQGDMTKFSLNDIIRFVVNLVVFYVQSWGGKMFKNNSLCLRGKRLCPNVGYGYVGSNA